MIHPKTNLEKEEEKTNWKTTIATYHQIACHSKPLDWYK